MINFLVFSFGIAAIIFEISHVKAAIVKLLPIKIWEVQQRLVFMEVPSIKNELQTHDRQLHFHIDDRTSWTSLVSQSPFKIHFKIVFQGEKRLAVENDVNLEVRQVSCLSFGNRHLSHRLL